MQDLHNTFSNQYIQGEEAREKICYDEKKKHFAFKIDVKKI